MINPLLQSISEDVMGFLNEIQLKYPDAISLASGRPDEHYFNMGDLSGQMDAYVDFVSHSGGMDKKTVLNSLGQYNRTKGIVNDLLCEFLRKDEKIEARPEDLLVTVGTQEALAIAVITLCDREKDVIIVEDPSYVGISHFSMITGYRIDTAGVGEHGICLEEIEEKVLANAAMGRRVKIVYVIPDFQNPTGAYMCLEKRRRLLELAVKYDFYILEDNAYSDYRYHDDEFVPIKALDTNNRVIYMRSFAKTLYPSLRLAVMVAGQKVEGPRGKTSLSDLMAMTKGYLTVNTPSINQAILGGILLKNNCSLRHANYSKIENMKEKRDLLLFYLQEHLRRGGASWTEKISWNIPRGGFFMTIRVPFVANKEEVVRCAEQFKVIFTPMSFFYIGEGGRHEIRIAFSNLSVSNLKTAVERLVRYFESKCST